MSAERDIVNFWYNKRGFFTINNIKAKSNRDGGIIALKFGDRDSEIYHIEISCSITSNITDMTNLSSSISKIVAERFEETKFNDLIEDKQKIKRIIVLGGLPQSRKKEIIMEFNKKDVEVVEFEEVIYEVLSKLDTKYYRNDSIRTLQVIKYFLLNEPVKLAPLLLKDTFTSSSRKKFLSNILENDVVIKYFKKTNILNKSVRSKKIEKFEMPLEKFF